jgi:hypothetical protein
MFRFLRINIQSMQKIFNVKRQNFYVALKQFFYGFKKNFMPTSIVFPKINIEIQKKLVEQVFGGGGGGFICPVKVCCGIALQKRIHESIFSFQLLSDIKCDN